eukprot:TRINITY_DN734_c3_g1_i1.p2 TRINITY_DN734_c3_g1~~TRINITY_DN734_c3_g1_i1.p2  ORF type:complete len:1458 (-),score=543.13 TRINITY_DN734_c3_g1_i1:22429-26802(-)
MHQHRRCDRQGQYLVLPGPVEQVVDGIDDLASLLHQGTRGIPVDDISLGAERLLAMILDDAAIGQDRDLPRILATEIAQAHDAERQAGAGDGLQGRGKALAQLDIILQHAPHLVAGLHQCLPDAIVAIVTAHFGQVHVVAMHLAARSLVVTGRVLLETLCIEEAERHGDPLELVGDVAPPVLALDEGNHHDGHVRLLHFLSPSFLFGTRPPARPGSILDHHRFLAERRHQRRLQAVAGVHAPGLAQHHLAAGVGLLVAHHEGQALLLAVCRQGVTQLAGIDRLVQRDHHAHAILDARRAQVHDLVGRHPQAAIEAVFGDLARDHQQFIFLDEVLEGFEQFVVDGGFDHAGAIVERADHQLAALGHLHPHAGDDAGQAARLPGGFQAGNLGAHEAAHFLFVGREQVAGQVEAQCALLFGQALLVAPGRYLHVFQRRFQVTVVAAEEAHLVGRLLGLLGAVPGQVDRGLQHRAVDLEAIEGAGTDQRIDGTAIDLLLVDPLGEVEEVLEGTVLARFQDGFDGVLPCPLDRPQAITDLGGLLARLTHGHEAVVGLVDVRRQDGQLADVERVLDEDLDLVRVFHGQRQVGGHERGGMVGLQVGRVVGQQRIGGRVRLVEAVAGELFHQVEDLVGLGLVQPVLGRPFAEQFTVLGHFLGLLLAHRPAQQVGAAQRVAADDLRHLHHLLLVDHDAVGLGENVLGARVGVVEGFTVLALAEVGDQVHRTGTVQRHQGDDVLETVGTGVLQHALHAAAFKLEHGDRLGLGQQFVRGPVVQRQLGQVELGQGWIEHADVAHRTVQDGQRGQAQEVELDQADGFHIVLVILRHHAGIAALGIERAEIGQLARGDQHATGVHADIAGDALDLLGQAHQLLDLFLVLQAFLQEWLFLDGVGQSHQLARLEGNQLGDTVAEVVAQVQHAPDVAHRALGRHGTEGGDLRDRLLAITVLDVLDHAVAAFLAEVDVEVGHRDAFGVQEAFEQQVVAQRIQVGDQQTVGHQRAGAGAPAGSDRHAIVLGPLDEVGHDEEVARELHLDDGVVLELQARLVAGALLLAFGLVGEQFLQAHFQAGLGLGYQEVVDGHAVRRGEVRQLRLAQLQHQVAALGDFDGVGQRARQVGEELGHLGLRLEILLVVEAAHAARIGHDLAIGDASPRLVGDEFLGALELDRMGGHAGQAQPASQGHALAHLHVHVGLAGALQFEIEGAGEYLGPAAGAGLGLGQVAIVDGLADITQRRARQRDQAIAAFLVTQRVQPFHAHFGAPLVLVAQPGLRQHFTQLQVAVTALDQDQQAVGLVAVGVVGDPQVAAGDGLDALATRFLVETYHAEQVGQVGDRDGGLSILGGGLDDVVDTHQAVHDGVLRVHTEVYKLRCSHRPTFYRSLASRPALDCALFVRNRMTLHKRAGALPASCLDLHQSKPKMQRTPTPRGYNSENSKTQSRVTNHAVPRYTLRQYRRLQIRQHR